MYAIEFQSVTLDFPVKSGAKYLKEQITGRFRKEKGKTKFRALNEVSLSIEKGEIVGIVGPNGCLLYTSPSPRDRQKSRMPSSA